MAIFVGLIALSILAGILAANKGRSGVGFFFLSVILSPAVGIIAAAVVKRDDAAVADAQVDAGEMKRCPYCDELVRSAASVCKHCGKSLPVAKIAGGIVIDEGR